MVVTESVETNGKLDNKKDKRKKRHDDFLKSMKICVMY